MCIRDRALDLINSRKVDMMKILTKTVTMDEAPDTIVYIEKNPGNYMKMCIRDIFQPVLC